MAAGSGRAWKHDERGRPKNFPGVQISFKRRNIKPKEDLAERKSKRSSGLDIIIAEDSPLDSTSKELKYIVEDQEVKLTNAITFQVYLIRLEGGYIL